MIRCQSSHRLWACRRWKRKLRRLLPRRSRLIMRWRDRGPSRTLGICQHYICMQVSGMGCVHTFVRCRCDLHDRCHAVSRDVAVVRQNIQAGARSAEVIRPWSDLPKLISLALHSPCVGAVRTYACFPVLLILCASALNPNPLLSLPSFFVSNSFVIFAARAVISARVASLISSLNKLAGKARVESENSVALKRSDAFILNEQTVERSVKESGWRVHVKARHLYIPNDTCYTRDSSEA